MCSSLDSYCITSKRSNRESAVWRGGRILHRWRLRVLVKTKGRHDERADEASSSSSSHSSRRQTGEQSVGTWRSVQQWRVRVVFDAPWDSEEYDANISIPLSAQEKRGSVPLRGAGEDEDDLRFETLPNGSAVYVCVCRLTLLAFSAFRFVHPFLPFPPLPSPPVQIRWHGRCQPAVPRLGALATDGGG